MLFSPLEQFNILSLSSFSLAGGFDVFYSSFLFFIWSLFFISPLSFFLSLDSFFFSFLSFFFSSFFSFFSAFIGFFVSLFISSSFFLQPTLFFFHFFLDSLFSFYISLFSYFWFFCYHNLNVFYSISSAAISFFFLPTLTDSVSSSLFLSFNINLISNSLFFVNFYFIFLEFFFVFKSFFYTFFVSPIFHFSLSNFSYLLFSFNSSTLFQFLGIFLIGFLLFSITWGNSLTLVAKHRWQNLLELFYQVILNVVNENAGPKGKNFFPLIFTTFVIILTCNVIGMIPYSFTVTSHLIVTFTTALAIFTGMNILGILKHGKHFLSLFFPPGAPMGLAPLLVLIEFISYIFRVLSLSIRLFANLMSGHTLLKILATFSWGTVSWKGLFLLPLTIIFIVTGLEMAIAFLQAYIFAVLLCIYLNDAFNLH